MALSLAEAPRELDRLYKARLTPELVYVPELPFLAIDGLGDPNGSAEYMAAIQALYSVSYTLKFALKRLGAPDVKVGPLEGLWWVDDMAHFNLADRAAWQWTAMIRQPEKLTAAMVEDACAEVAARKRLPSARHLRLERFVEGQCAQVMHIGPYASEEPTIGRLHAFIDEQGYEKRGKHHEIYLSDPRRTPEDRLRTIVRQPVSPAEPAC